MPGKCFTVRTYRQSESYRKKITNLAIVLIASRMSYAALSLTFPTSSVYPTLSVVVRTEKHFTNKYTFHIKTRRQLSVSSDSIWSGFVNYFTKANRNRPLKLLGHSKAVGPLWLLNNFSDVLSGKMFFFKRIYRYGEKNVYSSQTGQSETIIGTTRSNSVSAVV